MRRSQAQRGLGFVKGRDVRVDEESGGRQCHEQSVVMIEVLVEKTRNAGNPGEKRELMVVLGYKQGGLERDVGVGEGNGSCNSWP